MRELADDTTHITVLTGYHPDQFRVNMFDFIYHEHVSYFSCQDFINIGQRFDLELIDVQRVSLKGGAIQAIFRKKSALSQPSGEVARLAQYEHWLGIQNSEWFSKVSVRLKIAQESTHQLLSEVKAKKIAGYGVSHSVTTLIHQFQLVEKLSALTDDNQRILSKRGSAVWDPRTNQLFVQDVASRLEEVRKLVAKIDVPVRQVLIEARIVEATDSFSKNLGVRLGWNDTSMVAGARGRPGVMVSGNVSGTGIRTGQRRGPDRSPTCRPQVLRSRPI
jgi:hypothetical protein